MAAETMTMKRRWVIGVDGGGTKTRCVVVNQSGETEEPVGSFTSGSSNHNSVGERVAKRNVWTAIHGAIRDAMTEDEDEVEDGADVCGLCVCLSGVDTKQDEEMVEMWIRDEQRRCGHDEGKEQTNEVRDEETSAVWRAAMQKRLVVLHEQDDESEAGTSRASFREEDVYSSLYLVIENDAVGALCSGTKGVRRGCVLIAGTGTIATAMKGARRARAAGWGAAFGDGGCGYDIGYRAMCIAARKIDGRIRSDVDDRRRGLVREVMKAVGVSTGDELLSWAYRDTAAQTNTGDDRNRENDGAEKTMTGRWDRIASLAPAVMAAAADGDGDAKRILSESAMELAGSVEAAVRALSTSTPASANDASDKWTDDVVFVGGILAQSVADEFGRSPSMSSVANQVQMELTLKFPHARFSTPSAEPAMGAAWLIARLIAERWQHRTI